MGAMLQDVRYGWRLLLRQPGFTFVAVATLALGIGANTALFSVVNGVLLRPLPYPDADRLVMLWERNPTKDIQQRWVAPARYLAWKEQTRVFEELAYYKPYYDVTLTGGGQPEKVQQVPVSPNFLSFLGARPLLGRFFRPEEIAEGNNRVVILSHELWQQRFGGDSNVLERSIRLEGETYRIVGVLPPDFRIAGLLPLGFEFTTDNTLLTPITGMVWSARVYGNLCVLARLKPGVLLERAQTEMTAIAGRLAAEYPSTDSGWDVEVVPLRKQVLGEMETGLLLLSGAVGLVLLIACANVAGLLLARATARQKEMAVRAALGAGRLRMIRQMLAESLLLGLAGGAAGVLLAYGSKDALLALSPARLPRVESVALDLTVLSVALGLSLLTGLLFGLPPALQASKLNVQQTLNQGGTRGSSARGRWSLHGMLVVLEIALALVLVAGSGLLIRSFVRLWSVPPGFNTKNLLNLRIDLTRQVYKSSQDRVLFFSQLLPRLEALPGVESVGIINHAPLGGLSNNFRIWFPGESYARQIDIPTAGVRVANLAYFRTMGIPLTDGRFFEETAFPDGTGEAIISQAMARRYWPGESPLGKRMSIDGPEGPQHTIVGVVGDVRHYGLDQPAEPEFYLPYPVVAWRSVGLLVRSKTDPLRLVDTIRSAVWALDPEIVPYDIQTMETRLDDMLAGRRFSMTLLGLFAGAALLLASLGIYGVLAYSVAQRTQEIGIRMALGAQPGDILRLILRQGMTLTLLGVVLGLGGALALSRTLSSLLFEVQPTDPATFATVPLVLMGIALLACYLPARRATRVHPIEALRTE